MKAVLDASAALAVALKYDGHESVARALEACESILAPELFQSEIANALWKYVVFQGAEKEVALKLLNNTLEMVDVYLPTAENNNEAFFEAVNQKHPVYDMLYLTLARRNDAALITTDKKLGMLAAQLGITIYYDAAVSS